MLALVRRWLPLVLILSAVLVALACLFMSARTAVSLLQWRIDPLTLDDVHGSAWNGESRITFFGTHALGRMGWNADPLAIFSGAIRTDLHFDMPKNQRMDAHVERSLHTLEVTGLRADLVGGAMRKFFLRAHLMPIGSLHLEVQRVRFDDGIPVAVVGHASWRQATLVGPRTRLPYYLGDLRIDFYMDRPGVVLGRISDNGGPMQVDGDVRTDLIGYRIALRMKARDPQLAQGLTRLGQSQPDGGRLLVLQDAWWWKRKHG
ncbi:MAG: type II secretion system protein N [Lysobacteraceae bacterium]